MQGTCLLAYTCTFASAAAGNAQEPSVGVWNSASLHRNWNKLFQAKGIGLHTIEHVLSVYKLVLSASVDNSFH